MEKQTLSLEHNFRPSSSHTKNCPTIVMLHGFGSDENDLFSFSNELPNEYMIISLKAPLKLQPFGNAWYSIYFDQDNGKFSDNDQAIESRELVVKCIDEIIIKYHADKNNITLIGFSQGTILSFAVALSYPEMIKNVIGLSGYIDKEILVDGYSEKDHNDLNVYSSHGNVDQLIPVEWARNTKPFLEKMGIDCVYSEFPVGHGVAPQNFYEFKEWLLQHP